MVLVTEGWDGQKVLMFYGPVVCPSCISTFAQRCQMATYPPKRNKRGMEYGHTLSHPYIYICWAVRGVIFENAISKLMHRIISLPKNFPAMFIFSFFLFFFTFELVLFFS